MRSIINNQNDPQRITKHKPFINKYNCEGINFPSEKDDWKKIEKNNVIIALNVLYAKKAKVYPAYVSKHHQNHEKLWNHLAVKKLLTLLSRRITSRHQGDFYCPSCLLSFPAENKGESRKNVCENKGFCNVIMPSKDTKILELDRYQTCDKALFIIFADLECIIEKIDGFKKNPWKFIYSKSKQTYSIRFFDFCNIFV